MFFAFDRMGIDDIANRKRPSLGSLLDVRIPLDVMGSDPVEKKHFDRYQEQTTKRDGEMVHRKDNLDLLSFR
ncbi:MAG: hypothetical protein D6690_03190 [Nitrospirae bacterium]|nr:MAG: hypothetical protein D6690_03190 [Nitrospirota bacterium]